ncbi:DNA polymerase III subunit delta [Erythrobacter aquimaris]|uniref:DNA-directed DNA polymerase n=1 Tax=Qipengyuania aquimaris TaxID=255984 RepID=A0A6I4TQT5_9SPHN|nr:DNA polymerase III subunit delta [Qipengyuania aquimaris]MCA0903311.1 DNA polymerase III subunit delta [Qipengyuania aquimaris]MXO96773.1 DNA polymerase III subunit delta [Qipengyuania aquimaris]
MKVRGNEFAAKLQGLAKDCSIFFFCGQDEAGASAAARELVAALPDAGERVEIPGAELRADPARLGDEARSSSLFGDTRHIWSRVAGDEAHAALETLIKTGEMGAGEACPVIVVATSATDKSRTAKLLEKRKDAVVAMFYPPDLRSVTQSVRAMGDAAGVRLDQAVAERIARGANLDVRLAQSEVTKLATYLDATAQSPRPGTMEHLDAIGAASEEDGFASLVNAVLGGQTGKVGGEIARMKQVGLNPVGTLLAIERRAAQLARISAALGNRRYQDLDKGQKARLGIFWKEERDIADQVNRWRGPKLDRLTNGLTKLHRDLLSNSQAAELLLAQGLTNLARLAARR